MEIFPLCQTFVSEFHLKHLSSFSKMGTKNFSVTMENLFLCEMYIFKKKIFHSTSKASLCTFGLSKYSLVWRWYFFVHNQTGNIFNYENCSAVDAFQWLTDMQTSKEIFQIHWVKPDVLFQSYNLIKTGQIIVSALN